MNTILKKWRKNSIKVLIIIIGLTLGILAISIGISFINEALAFSEEISNGNSKISETLMYHCNGKNIEKLPETLENLMINLNRNYQVTIGSVSYPLQDKSLTEPPSIIPIIYNKDVNWRPNLVYGRYLTLEESKSNKNVALVGYKIFDILYKNKKLSSDMKINIFGQPYSIVGVIGRTKRYAPQSYEIEIPYKKYSSFYKEEPDINNIPIFIYGNKNFNLNEYNCKQLSIISKPDYVNDIKIPLKLVIIVGLLILITTIINENNLFSLWILKSRKDISIKKALGATNFIIILQVLFEALLLSFISIAFALIIQFFVLMKLNSILTNYELSINYANFIVSILMACLISVLSVLIPCKFIISTNPLKELKM